MLYLAYDEMISTLARALQLAGLDDTRAARLARVFAQNSAEGVYSHGVNRFPRFLKDVKDGVVDVHAAHERVSGLGGLEVWDAHFGVGPLTAEDAMARACELAETHGIACVAVRNSNHWMRPGRYGWQAADKGMIGICWSNTSANMPAWGAVDPKLGNNPIVLAIPREKGHVVVDMAMTQFAYGKLEIARLSGEQLPIPGGYDEAGNLTTDPAAIAKTRRMLPIGYWKGSSLSLALDLIASAVSMGRSVSAISRDPFGTEHGLTQTFIAINFRGAVDAERADEILDDAVNFLLSSTPVDPDSPVRYPGQNIAAIREKNVKNGTPIHEETWQKVLDFIAAREENH